LGDCERLVGVLLYVSMGPPDGGWTDSSRGRVELCSEVVVGAQ